jgi:hypothetical protein
MTSTPGGLRPIRSALVRTTGSSHESRSMPPSAASRRRRPPSRPWGRTCQSPAVWSEIGPWELRRGDRPSIGTPRRPSGRSNRTLNWTLESFEHRLDSAGFEPNRMHRTQFQSRIANRRFNSAVGIRVIGAARAECFRIGGRGRLSPDVFDLGFGGALIREATAILAVYFQASGGQMIPFVGMSL